MLHQKIKTTHVSLLLTLGATALAGAQTVYLHPEGGIIHPNGTAAHPWNFLESALETGVGKTIMMQGGKTIYGPRTLNTPVTLSATGGATTIGTPLTGERTKNPQYGFSHRTNDWDVIIDVLDSTSGAGTSAGNAIECDIGYSALYDDWIVSHDSFDFPSFGVEYLYEWLGLLKTHLATGNYDQSFAALWLDIKTPNTFDSDVPSDEPHRSLQRVVDLVRANVPSSVAVIYDLTGPENFGVGITNPGTADETRGYRKIKQIGLRPNEGVGCWFNIHSNLPFDEGDFEMDRLYDILKADGITRCVAHHGHAFNLDADVLILLNDPKFHQKSDPFRFNKIFTWTHDLRLAMELYMDPSTSYHTDGQIVGDPAIEWYAGYGDLDDFDGAIGTYSATQRKAQRSLEDFWYRSGSTVP